jgi:hypothetical protein
VAVGSEPRLRRALGLDQGAPARAGAQEPCEPMGAPPVRGRVPARLRTGWRRRRARRSRPTARRLARAWLCGALDAEVRVPLALACTALALASPAVAEAVGRRLVPMEAP